MPHEHIKTCNESFVDDLAEITKVTDYVSKSYRLYARAGEVRAWVAQQADLAALVDEFRSAKLRVGPEAIFQALFVQAWAAFEAFVRNLMISYMNDFYSRKTDYETLFAANLIDRNIYHTGIALQQIFDNRTNYSLDYAELARNAGSGHKASTRIVLNTLAFTFFLKGPSKAGIEEAFKRIGARKVQWVELGKVSAIQKLLGTTKANETMKKLIEFLESSEKKRNQIVHRGERLAVVTEAELRSAIGILGALGAALAELARKELQKRVA